MKLSTYNKIKAAIAENATLSNLIEKFGTQNNKLYKKMLDLQKK